MTNVTALKKYLILASICIITFFCFQYTVNNQFTNWDDDFYVTNDPYIKAFTPHNLKVIFTEDITRNNYHPLCMLSLAINYHFSQMDPHAYYLTNILIHVANVILVFFLMMGLCALLKMDEKGKLFVASFGALWFGIHPMHVESVAWIAERKDVLYAFFYILGLLCYLKYLATNKMSWYWVTFIVFIASCLSKPMAVVFPMSLLCIDILAQRQLSKKLVTEKILFFVFSLICGGLAFYTQNKTGAIASFGVLTIYQRFMYAGYSFIMYVCKLFNPTYLSTFYPYPFPYINGYYHTIYYAAPFIALGIVGLPLWYTYYYKRQYFRIVAFGMGFFVANVIFILQFISVGAAIMSDRYSYVAYIGLLFLLAYFLNELMKQQQQFIRIIIMSSLIAASGWLGYLCYERTFVWHDSETLLSDAIDKYPIKKDADREYDKKNSGVAILSYKWLGNYYLAKGDLSKALEQYNVTILLRQADAKTFDKVGNIYATRKQYDSALICYDQSMAIQSNVPKTYADRSMAYMMMGDTLNAFKDFIVAYQMNPDNERAFSQAVFDAVQRKDYDIAISEYNMLLKVINNPFYYFYRGVAKFSKNDIDAAIVDWEIAVKYNNRDVQQSASYNLAVAYESKGEYKKAVDYAVMAKKVGYAITDEYLATLQKELAQGKK